MIRLDKHDVQILDALQKNGRATRAKLGRIANLSSSTVHDRIVRLEQYGVICSYHAVIDIQKLVSIDTLFVQVSLQSHKSRDFDRFEQKIRQTPAITECVSVAGGCDYILRFVVRNIHEYQIIFDDLLNSEVGIDRYFTYVVTKKIKEYTGFPILDLF